MYTDKEMAFLDALDNQMSDSDYREVVSYINAWDGSLEDYEWYPMDEFEDLTDGIEKMDLIMRAYYGGFVPTHDYFRFDSNGNLESCYFIDYDSYNKSEIKGRIIDFINDGLASGLPDWYSDLWDEIEMRFEEDDDLLEDAD